VDDNKGFNETTCDLLETRGHVTLSAYTGEAALQQLKKNALDLALIDLKLPDISGIEFLAEIKDNYPDIGCIIVTGFSSTETAIESLNLEAEAYLTKPIDPVDLFEMVERAARRRERRLYERELDGLNQLLRAIRNVNQLIVREEKSEELLEKVCELLVETRAFHNAWIAILDDGGKPIGFYQSGLGEEFNELIEKTGLGWIPRCIKASLNDPGVQMIENPSITCQDCPLSDKFKYGGSIFTTISYGDKVFGVLVISSSKDIKWEEERSLIKEVSTDVAFALNRLEIEKEKNHFYWQLQERNKELMALYSLSKLVNQYGYDYDQICMNFVDLLPQGYQYPNITCARIVLDDKVYSSLNFRESQWSQSSEIIIEGVNQGCIEIFILEEPELGEDPFLPQEKGLLDEVANQLSNFYHHSMVEKERDLVLNQFKSLFNLTVDPMVIVDPRGIIIEVTERVSEVIGYNREQIMGKTINDLGFLTQESKHVLLSNLRKRVEGLSITPYQVDLITKSGEEKHFEVKAEKIEYRGEIAIMAAFRDVTERITYEKRMESLHTFSSKINRIDSLELVAEETLETLNKLLGFENASFGLIEEGNITFIRSIGPDIIRKLPLDGPGLTVKAVNTGQSQLVHDIRLSPDYISGRGKSSFKTLSELDVPIKLDGEVVALINLESDKLNSFDEKDQKIVEIMSMHISSVIAKLRQMNKLEELIKKRTEELEKAYSDLQELDRMKDQFISTATHELRTPLVSIKGYVDYIQGGTVGEVPKRVKELLSIVQRNTKRLSSITDDLLDQQRIESGRLEIHTEPTPLEEIVHDVFEEITPLVDEKNQTLEIIIPKELPILELDRTRISQVLVNLLGNASKFSTESSKIKLCLREAEEHVRISIADEGIGLSAEDIDKLFKPFPEIDRPNIAGKSTGLGLSICKGIVELHGGRIWVESEGRGKGATFTFTLPKRTLDSPKVLLVDDEADIRNLGKRILEKRGYSVLTVGDAGKALRIAGEEHPNIILLDIVMPGRNGFDVCRELKLKPITKDIPVVMFSVLDRDVDKRMAIEAGADDYITKPFEPEQLIKRINKLLNKE
jgi:PAS domain S-box-containing protein